MSCDALEFEVWPGRYRVPQCRVGTLVVTWVASTAMRSHSKEEQACSIYMYTQTIHTTRVVPSIMQQAPNE